MTITDLEEARARREDATLAEDAARWRALRDAILETMLLSRLGDTAVISATLRALLDILTASDAGLEDARSRITATLRAFSETSRRA